MKCEATTTVGCEPTKIPEMPIRLGEATHDRKNDLAPEGGSLPRLVRGLRNMAKWGLGPCGGGGTVDDWSCGRREAEERMRKEIHRLLKEFGSANVNDALVRIEDVPGTVRRVKWRRDSMTASAEVDALHAAMYAEGWICLKGTDIDDADNFIRTYWKPNDLAHGAAGGTEPK